MSNALTTDEILDTLDAAAEEFEFPDFEHIEIDYLSSRLEVYADERRWALVFNTIGWNDTRFCTMLESFGNCVADPSRAEPRRSQVQADGNKLLGQVMRDMLGADPTDIESMLRAAQRSNEERLAQKEEYDAAVGQIIEKNSLESDPTLITPGEIEVEYLDDDSERVLSVRVRGRPVALESLVVPKLAAHENKPAFLVSLALLQEHRESLLATPEEVARLFPSGMPPRLLVLDDWRHVDFDTLPSDNETFRLLAEVMVHRDASLYRPTVTPNTHWSRWLKA